MISQHGALGATRKLLAAPAVSDGFVKLWENDRLDLTAERSCSTSGSRPVHRGEREIGAPRLDDFGYRRAA